MLKSDLYLQINYLIKIFTFFFENYRYYIKTSYICIVAKQKDT